MRLLALGIGVLFLCGSVVIADDRSHAKQSSTDAKKLVTALHLDVVDSRKDDLPKDFTEALTKKLWRNWLSLMPQSAMLGDSGKVTIRFQIQRDPSDPTTSPSVEVSSGKNRKPLVDAALKAIHNTTKKLKFPEAFAGSRIEFRAVFQYNQPLASVQQ